jgi:two-component system, chemotaxis family, chemotaxis protein CheY
MYWMPRILIADDNELMRSLMARFFENLLPEAEILIAESGEEALQLAGSFGGDVAIAILDYQMAGMNGLDCAVKLRELNPEIEVRIITGELLDPILKAGHALGIPVMEKPPAKQDFKALIDRLRDQ